jgi:hypothetical protein
MRIEKIAVLAGFLFTAAEVQAVTVDPLVQVDGSSLMNIVLNSLKTTDGEIIPSDIWSSYIKRIETGSLEGFSNIYAYDQDGRDRTDDLQASSSRANSNLSFLLYDRRFFGRFDFINDAGAIDEFFFNASAETLLLDLTITAEATLSWAVDYPSFDGGASAGATVLGCQDQAQVSASVHASLYNGNSGRETASHSKTFNALVSPGESCRFTSFGGEGMNATWSPTEAPTPIPLPSALIMLASAVGLVLAVPLGRSTVAV